MEGTPSGISYDSVKKDLLKINGVSNVHDLQMWCITVDKLAVMVHLQVGKSEEVRGIEKKKYRYVERSLAFLQVTNFKNYKSWHPKAW